MGRAGEGSASGGGGGNRSSASLGRGAGFVDERSGRSSNPERPMAPLNWSYRQTSLEPLLVSVVDARVESAPLSPRWPLVVDRRAWELERGSMRPRKTWTPLRRNEVASLLVLEGDPASIETIRFLRSRNVFVLEGASPSPKSVRSFKGGRVLVQVVPISADNLAGHLHFPRLLTSRGRYSGLESIKRAIEYSVGEPKTG